MPTMATTSTKASRPAETTAILDFQNLKVLMAPHPAKRSPKGTSQCCFRCWVLSWSECFSTCEIHA